MKVGGGGQGVLDIPGGGGFGYIWVFLGYILGSWGLNYRGLAWI